MQDHSYTHKDVTLHHPRALVSKYQIQIRNFRNLKTYVFRADFATFKRH